MTYLKEESVALAVQLLDGASLRFGLPPMAVAPARFAQKGDEYRPRATAAARKRKRKAIESLERRALGWEGLDDRVKRADVTVILKHMFDPGELAAGGAPRAAELEEDVLREAMRHGRVETVRVFPAHRDGVVSVRFGARDAADACVAAMDGRFYDGRRVAAARWDGRTNYSAEQKVETEEEQAARLEAYARELEAGAGTAAAQGTERDAETGAAQVAPVSVGE